jgi:hypothetical protein
MSPNFATSPRKPARQCVGEGGRLLRLFEDELRLRYAERTVDQYLAVCAFLGWLEARGIALVAVRSADLEAYQSEL